MLYEPLADSNKHDVQIAHCTLLFKVWPSQLSNVRHNICLSTFCTLLLLARCHDMRDVFPNVEIVLQMYLTLMIGSGELLAENDQ